jgi:hypothetical protein
MGFADAEYCVEGAVLGATNPEESTYARLMSIDEMPPVCGAQLPIGDGERSAGSKKVTLPLSFDATAIARDPSFEGRMKLASWVSWKEESALWTRRWAFPPPVDPVLTPMLELDHTREESNNNKWPMEPPTSSR